MRVGLISKPEHCRPHVRAIKALGVKVEVLGGDPGLTIPRRVDAVVVRTCSISHAAFNVAKAWERDGGTAFFVEGANKAAEAVKEWMDMTLRNLLNQMMDKFGWVHWYLVCKWSPVERKAIGYTGYEKEIEELHTVTPSGVRTAILDLARARGWGKHHLSDANGGTPGRPIQVWAGPDADPKTLNAFTRHVGKQKSKGTEHTEAAAMAVVEAPQMGKVVGEVKAQCDANTQAILEVMDEQRTGAERHDLLLVTTCELADRILVLEEGRGLTTNQTTNPFAVIEDFKRRLAESGFRGTLTLTIGEAE